MANQLVWVDSTTKTLPASLRTGLVHNVRSYGALGNGTTDDTAAIQAAIDDCTTTSGNVLRGGIVYFPKGRYRITSTLLLRRWGGTLQGAGWSNWQSGWNADSHGSVILWDGGEAPMIEVQGSTNARFDSLMLIGNGTAGKVPTAGIRFRVETADTFHNSQMTVNRCLIGKYANVDSMSGIVMGVGILFDGVDAQNDRGTISNCRIDGCTTGIKTTGGQNVQHDIVTTTIGYCGTGIETRSQMNARQLWMMWNTVRDIDITSTGRLAIRELASERSAQMARIRAGGSLTVDGGYWQISTQVQADRVIIDAVDDTRATIRLKDFLLTAASGYGDHPIIKAKGATSSTSAVKTINLDNVRWLSVGGGAPATITSAFFDVAPAGTADTVTVYGNVQDGNGNAGAQKFFHNTLKGSVTTLNFDRTDGRNLLGNMRLNANPGLPLGTLHASTGIAVTAGRYYGQFFRVPEPIILSGMSILVSVVGAASSLARLGVYRIVDPKFAPTAASGVVDVGTVAVDALDVRTATLGAPVVLQPGVYSTFVVSNGAPTIQWARMSDAGASSMSGVATSSAWRNDAPVVYDSATSYTSEVAGGLLTSRTLSLGAFGAQSANQLHPALLVWDWA